ncbi:male-specific histamine-binding salivary protein [Ixodes scapularis]|uniref:male-specific histamine-binding salivary protein n=1 Tax=Ixodes scapularis TaxID=6945 RepID=UPI001A9E5D30|nr:male-specific histamine-binding salivary protein [Ixodes scapularis]
MCLAAVVLATLLAITMASEKEKVNLPERQLKLSLYQDAWKSVKNPAKRYLKYRSYVKDEMFGGSSKCMFIQQTQHENFNKTAKTEMGFYNSTRSCVVKYTVCTHVETTEPYCIPNVIRAARCTNSSLYADSPIIFSDYKSCDVVRAPHTGNPLDCELWVAEANINDVPSICEFAYDVFCNTTEKYIISDQSCTNPTKQNVCQIPAQQTE